MESVDEFEESKLPYQTSLDSLRICLFCNKEFSGIKKCLDHMRLKHSFFILDIDCVSNLKGLLTYIAERIQLGYLCLFCSKMFKNSRRCQQHMLDKMHTFMNMEDENEYEQFYDFSKTYENHPLADAKQEVKEGESKVGESKEAEHDAEWEDVDLEDANEDDLNNESDEEPAEKVNKNDQTPSSEAEFSVISEEDAKNTDSFSKIDMASEQKSKTERFGADSVSSIKEAKERKRKTREEARLGLNIKQAELLDSGEIKLGNGKIIGHRQFAYIYKQRYRVPDHREAVIVNKLSLEYRRLKAITDGADLESIKQQNPQYYLMMQKQVQYQKYLDMKVGVRHHKLQHHFRKSC